MNTVTLPAPQLHLEGGLCPVCGIAVLFSLTEHGRVINPGHRCEIRDVLQRLDDLVLGYEALISQERFTNRVLLSMVLGLLRERGERT